MAPRVKKSGSKSAKAKSQSKSGRKGTSNSQPTIRKSIEDAAPLTPPPDDVPRPPPSTTSSKGSSSSGIASAQYQAIPIPPWTSTTNKRKRGQSSPDNSADPEHVSPYGAHLNVKYRVKALRKDILPWNELKRYDSIKIGEEYDDDGAVSSPGESFSVGELVYINPANPTEQTVDPNDADQFDTHWVARILEARSNKDVENVFILVVWLWRPQEVRELKKTLPTKSRPVAPEIMGEVLPSNSLEILNATTIEAKVDVLEHFSEAEVHDGGKSFEELMWYRTYDFVSVAKTVEVPVTCPSCDKCDRFNEDTMVKCKGCGTTSHIDCVVKNEEERAKKMQEDDAEAHSAPSAKSPKTNAKDTPSKPKASQPGLLGRLMGTKTPDPQISDAREMPTITAALDKKARSKKLSVLITSTLGDETSKKSVPALCPSCSRKL